MITWFNISVSKHRGTKLFLKWELELSPGLLFIYLSGFDLGFAEAGCNCSVLTWESVSLATDTACWKWWNSSKSDESTRPICCYGGKSVHHLLTMIPKIKWSYKCMPSLGTIPVLPIRQCKIFKARNQYLCRSRRLPPNLEKQGTTLWKSYQKDAVLSLSKCIFVVWFHPFHPTPPPLSCLTWPADLNKCFLSKKRHHFIVNLHCDRTPLKAHMLDKARMLLNPYAAAK